LREEKRRVKKGLERERKNSSLVERENSFSVVVVVVYVCLFCQKSK
jgi:hypothetical protein